MNRADITAIVPMGFAKDSPDGSPAELFEVEGLSLLCRALAEVAGSGIYKALIVVTYNSVIPAWVPITIQKSQSILCSLGLPNLNIEILYLDGCCRLDDAVGLAMARLKKQWVAVICPLIYLPDLTALSNVVETAENLNRAVIGITQVNWEMAIQLCTLTIADNHLACTVEYYCPPDDELTVYAGRAVLPTSSRPIKGFGPLWICENEALVDHFITALGPLPTRLLPGPLCDLRFSEIAAPQFLSKYSARLIGMDLSVEPRNS